MNASYWRKRLGGVAALAVKIGKGAEAVPWASTPLHTPVRSHVTTRRNLFHQLEVHVTDVLIHFLIE